MIRVLQVVSSLDGGGVENLLLNYYSTMNREEYIFDFIVQGNKIGKLEENFKKMNSNIHHIPSKHESLIENLKQSKRIIESGNYDVIHVHQGIKSVFPIYFAKKANIKMRIAHSHIALKNENKFSKIINKLLLIFLKKNSTHWFACGIDAGKFLWGENDFKNGKVQVLNNAIDIDKFIFNQNIRDSIRKKLGLEGKFVIGNVGRFTYQKNHEFLIRVFKEIYKKDKNVILLLIGNGELENEVKQQVIKLGLNKVVKFLGVRDDVPKLLQAMDVFVLPSRFEGLPVVLVEAQAAGLMCVVANTITKEVKVTDNMEYISLEVSPKDWASTIYKYESVFRRRDTSEEIKKAEFDIKVEAKKLEMLYSKEYK